MEEKDYRNNSLYHQSIDIDVADGVSIHLSKEEYQKFINKMVPELQDEIEGSIRREKKSDKKLEECYNFLKDIGEFFYGEDYNNNNDGYYCCQNPIDELDPDQLSIILKKYKNLLGFI